LFRCPSAGLNQFLGLVELVGVIGTDVGFEQDVSFGNAPTTLLLNIKLPRQYACRLKDGSYAYPVLGGSVVFSTTYISGGGFGGVIGAGPTRVRCHLL